VKPIPALKDRTGHKGTDPFAQKNWAAASGSAYTQFIFQPTFGASFLLLLLENCMPNMIRQEATHSVLFCSDMRGSFFNLNF
jgi:hypothetical protein